LTQFWAAICIAILTSVFVILFAKKSLWITLEFIIGLFCIFYFIYIYILIFKGIRFNKKETYSINWKPFNIDSPSIDMIGSIDTGGALTSAGAEAGPLGCLAGIILDIIVSIFLVFIIAFLLWLGMNVIVTGILILLLPFYLLFRRSLRVAIAKGRTCHGQVGKSLLYASWTTLLNMTWLYVIIFLGHILYNWQMNR